MASFTLLETAYSRAIRWMRASASLRSVMSVTMARVPATRPSSLPTALAETIAHRSVPSRRRRQTSYCSASARQGEASRRWIGGRSEAARNSKIVTPGSSSGRQRSISARRRLAKRVRPAVSSSQIPSWAVSAMRR
jgi:hypothetical protein